MDITAFIAPVLTALLTGASIYVGISEQIAIIKTEIKNLTQQVEKHNSVVERTFKIESDNATMWRRLDELRDEVEKLREKLEVMK